MSRIGKPPSTSAPVAPISRSFDERSPAQRIAQAFSNTPVSDLRRRLFLHNPRGGAVGSIFREPQTVESLRDASWAPYPHPEVEAPYQAFRAEIPGEVGVIDLGTLYPGAYVKLVDRTRTGLLEPVAILRRHTRPEVDYSTLVVGPDPQSGEDRVWSFQPGEPNPLLPRRKRLVDGQIYTVDDVREMGFRWANVQLEK